MPAAAIIGAAVVSGVMSNNAADTQADAATQAARTSAASADKATALQEQIYNQNRTDQTPWRNTGANALAQLSYGLGLGDTGSGYNVSNNLAAGGTPGVATGNKTAEQYRAELAPQYTSGGSSYEVANSGRDDGGGAPFAGFTPGVVDETALNAAIQARMQTDAQTAQAGQQSANAFVGQGTSGDLIRPFGMSDYQEDPGYQFRLSEGLKALDKSAAARGGLLSGGALKGISRYGQDMASQEYQNAYNRYTTNQTNQYNRLASAAGLGQTANNALAQSGQNYANQAGQIGMQSAANQGNAALAAGQARASSYSGIGNALGQVPWSNLAGGSQTSFGGPLDSFYGGVGGSGD